MTTSKIIFITLTIFLWIIVTLYWILSARKVGDNHKGNETFSFIKLIASALIIYLPLLTGSFITTELFQPTFISELFGTILCAIGIWIMVWSRKHLAKNWSGNVILQQEHSLSMSGPYKYARHPIYSGGLLSMLASAIVVGKTFGFIWLLFCAFGLIMKIKQEEKLLTKKFPNEYPLYKKQVKKLIPFIL